MNHIIHKKQSGFTIIELTIAMGFVSAILIAIALTIIQVSGIYNRGVTLKQVNQAGRAVSSELQDSISAASPFSVDADSDTPSVVLLEQDWGGAFCMGDYSFIWNYGEAIDKALSDKNFDNLNIYTDVNYSESLSENKIPHFIKTYDPGREYCVINEGKKIEGLKISGSTDLLAVGQSSLVIHELKFSSDSDDLNPVTNQQLYDITITIGTNERDTLYTDAEGILSCKPPTILNADPTYCSIQQFHLVTRAGIGN